MRTENELKLIIPSSDLPRVQRQAWLRKLINGPSKHETLVSVYYDTKAFKLHSSGISLRIRKNGRKGLQTIKARPDGRNSAFGRREWETEITGGTPNYKLAKGTALEPLLSSKLKRSLQPIFETKIERTILPVRIGNSQIEVALDHGQIHAAKRRQPVSEIELELKSGKPADVARLGQLFARNLPVSYGVHAKADRGYALIRDTRNKPVVAGDIALLPNTSVAEAFTIIGLACLDHLVSNEEAILHASSEGVHQMRVGLRRLRAAISVFKDVVQGPETEKIKVELKWLTEELGPARDFDILVAESIVPLQIANPKNADIALLRTDLIRRRHSGFDKAKAAVKCDRYKRLVLQTALWLANGKWLRTTDPLWAAKRNRKIEKYAAELLNSRTKKVLKKVAHLHSLDAQQRHKVRIAAKTLRYETEFFEGVFPEKSMKAGRKKFQDSLEALQDSLGTLNDIAVHETLARIYTHPKRWDRLRPAKAFAMGMLTGQEETKSKSCMATAIEAARRLRDAPRYWR